MKSGFFSLIIILLLLIPVCNVSAQYGGPRFSYGICFGAAAKTGLIQQPRMKYGLWGEANLGMYAALKGPSPGSLGAWLHAQLFRDDVYIKMGEGEGYILESTGILVNPEISIPLRSRNGEYKVELLAGIGTVAITGQSLTMRNVEGYTGGTFLDLLADSVAAARRQLQPFITAGLAFRLHRRGSLIVKLRQDMQNAFYSGNEVTFYASTGPRTVNLSVQATRLLIGVEIKLGKLPEVF